MIDKHILVVEDEANTRLTLSLILRKARYQVTVVGNGQEALFKISLFKNNSNPVHLLLTDIQMPGLTGIELIEQLSKTDPDLPILVITGYGDEEMAEELRRLGCSKFIEKPFDSQKLLNRIASIVKDKPGYNNNIDISFNSEPFLDVEPV